eukprot:366452-Chlamydomonas_euryale.AAC.4
MLHEVCVYATCVAHVTHRCSACKRRTSCLQPGRCHAEPGLGSGRMTCAVARQRATAHLHRMSMEKRPSARSAASSLTPDAPGSWANARATSTCSNRQKAGHQESRLGGRRGLREGGRARQDCQPMDVTLPLAGLNWYSGEDAQFSICTSQSEFSHYANTTLTWHAARCEASKGLNRMFLGGAAQSMMCRAQFEGQHKNWENIRIDLQPAKARAKPRGVERCLIDAV